MYKIFILVHSNLSYI